jgi:hypothetical protein
LNGGLLRCQVVELSLEQIEFLLGRSLVLHISFSLGDAICLPPQPVGQVVAKRNGPTQASGQLLPDDLRVLSRSVDQAGEAIGIEQGSADLAQKALAAEPSRFERFLGRDRSGGFQRQDGLLCLGFALPLLLDFPHDPALLFGQVAGLLLKALDGRPRGHDELNRFLQGA